VHRLVADALKARTARTAEATDELRRLETARLDALQSSLWDQEMTGDLTAARAVCGIILARCRLLGLNDRHFNAIKVKRPRTVVIAPND